MTGTENHTSSEGSVSLRVVPPPGESPLLSTYLNSVHFSRVKSALRELNLGDSHSFYPPFSIFENLKENVENNIFCQFFRNVAYLP